MIESKQLKKFIFLAISAAILGLSGCGGGGGGESAPAPAPDTGDSGSSVGAALLCFALVLVSGDDECVTAAVSGSGSTGSSGSGGSSNTGGSPPPTSGNRSYLMDGSEMEPNNELINANIPRFATRTDPNDQTGWIVTGTVNDVGDTRDAFAVTPRRSYRYRIALCPPGERACENLIGMDPLTLFWRILDQDGNEITSTQGAYSNKAHVMLDAGVLYYVVVDAGDAMGVNVEYRLYVYEQG